MITVVTETGEKIEVPEVDFELEAVYQGERGCAKIANGSKVLVRHFQKSSMIHMICLEESNSAHFCVRLHSIWHYVNKESVKLNVGSIEQIDALQIALPISVADKTNPEFLKP